MLKKELGVGATEGATHAEGTDEQEDPFKDVPILHHAKAELYLFDTDADLFVIQEKEVDADMGSNGQFDSTYQTIVN